MKQKDQTNSKKAFCQEFVPSKQHPLLKQILKDVKSKKEIMILAEVFRPKFFEDL